MHKLNLIMHATNTILIDFLLIMEDLSTFLCAVSNIGQFLWQTSQLELQQKLCYQIIHLLPECGVKCKPSKSSGLSIRSMTTSFSGGETLSCCHQVPLGRVS